MSQRGSGSEIDAIAAWRKSMLDRALVMCFVLLGVALMFSLWKPQVFHGRFMAIALLPGWLLVSTALYPKTPLLFRQFAATAGMLTAVVGSVALLGLQAINGFTAHLMVMVMVALFMGRTAGWFVWAAGIASWLAIAVYAPGTASVGGNALHDPSLRNWLRVICFYALLSGSTLAIVAYLAGRMEKALRRSQALNDALTEESTRRIAALEEQRAQSQKMEALGTLAGGIAHDFNNLLVVIINHAELAAMDATPATRDSLAQIETAGQRAASLTQRLLTFGRRQVSEQKVLDLNARVEEALSRLRRLLPATIKLERDLAPDAPCVRAAEVDLDQIIMNLCVNARDAMPEGGRLTVRTSLSQHPAHAEAGRPRTFVCLTVTDSGLGMDAATQERMFEPFFTTKGKGQGTGLGLSTVHALVQGSGGFIEVASQVGQGTSVRIFLPEHGGEASVPVATPRPNVRPGHETILIADDDPQVREIMARRLRDNGYRVIVCQDGEEALREYRRTPDDIALVISDAVMPKLGGRELHRLLSSEYGEIPFLICSGYAAQTIESTFFDLPLRSFLQKPFDDHALQVRVRALIDAGRTGKSVPPRAVRLSGTVETVGHS